MVRIPENSSAKLPWNAVKLVNFIAENIKNLIGNPQIFFLLRVSLAYLQQLKALISTDLVSSYLNGILLTIVSLVHIYIRSTLPVPVLGIPCTVHCTGEAKFCELRRTVSIVMRAVHACTCPGSTIVVAVQGRGCCELPVRINLRNQDESCKILCTSIASRNKGHPKNCSDTCLYAQPFRSQRWAHFHFFLHFLYFNRLLYL